MRPYTSVEKKNTNQLHFTKFRMFLVHSGHKKGKERTTTTQNGIPHHLSIKKVQSTNLPKYPSRTSACALQKPQ